MKKMNEDAKQFEKNIPFDLKYTLDSHWKRFDTVLQQKPLEMTKVQKVDWIDPEKLLPIFTEMQKKVCCPR